MSRKSVGGVFVQRFIIDKWSDDNHVAEPVANSFRAFPSASFDMIAMIVEDSTVVFVLYKTMHEI